MKQQRLDLEHGEVMLFRGWLTPSQAREKMVSLMEDMTWSSETLRMFGRQITVPRQVAWYGDPGAGYRYSGVDHDPLPWLPELEDLRNRVQHHTRCQFNGMLGNLYRDGTDHMGWHSDDEPTLGPSPTLASISLGATRRMRFRHRRRELPGIGVDLAAGDLLVMSGDIQRHWQHAVMRTSRKVGPRINLTFRLLVNA